MRSKPSNLDVKLLGRKKARYFAAIAPKVEPELPLCVERRDGSLYAVCPCIDGSGEWDAEVIRDEMRIGGKP